MKLRKFTIVNGLQILNSICNIRMGKRIPLYCEWEVTSRCNMKCDFCSTRIPGDHALIDTSREEARNIIGELSGMGTKIIHFSGGEPTLREDLPELVALAKENNMIVSITTNGSASMSRRIGLLHADLIRISIDGPEQFHDSMRKTPGAFRKTVETLRFLISKGKKPLITAIYTEQTTRQMLVELINIASSLGTRVLINNQGRNLYDEHINQDLNSPYFSDYISMVSRLWREHKKTVVDPNLHLTVIKKGGLDVYGCRAMDIAISIKHDGAVSLPCNALAISSRKCNLKEAYYGREALKIRALQGKHPACKGCNIRCMEQASRLLKIKDLGTIMRSYMSTLF